MDLNETLFFTQVVRAGSFTRAGAVLGITKSKISRKVQELERRLGVSLLQRTTRSLRLTPAGEEYFRRCARALDEIQDAENRATQSQQSIRGTLRVTAAVDVGVSILGSILREFLGKYPDIRVELILSDELVDLVKQGFDLALRMGGLEDSALMARKLGSFRMGLFASPRYLKARGTPRTPQELMSHTCIGFIGDGSLVPWVLRNDKATQKILPPMPFATNNFLLLHLRALAGDGIAYLPTFQCAADLREKRLVPVLEDWKHRGDVAHLVYPKREFLPKRVKVLSDFLAERLQGYFR